jgi:hypothetical protein
LIALLLPAIQKARELAAKTESINNLKQIDLASHHFAETYAGKLPILNGGPPKGPTFRQTVFVSLLPYIEQGAIFEAYKEATGGLSSNFTIKLFLSPADPTTTNGQTAGLCSYAVNSQVFVKFPNMDYTFQDGTSNTITFAEHYASGCNKTTFEWFSIVPDILPNGSIHRAAFADNGTLVRKADPNGANNYQDAYPITAGNPPSTVGSIPGLTFQVRPRISDCDPRVAQTPHSGGMLAALADDSVRTLAAGMSETTYWAAVTPAGGEVSGADW